MIRFEIVIADDGSSDDVADVVRRWRQRLELEHIWQPKEGFRKARALDLAALAARGDYLAFLDADACLAEASSQRFDAPLCPVGFLDDGARHALGMQFSGPGDRERDFPLFGDLNQANGLLRAPRKFGTPRTCFVPARDRRRPWATLEQQEFVPPVAAYTLIGVFRDAISNE